MSTDHEDHEARLKMLETRANVTDMHSEHLAKQIADLVLTMQAMHRDLRDQLQQAAEKRAAAHQEFLDHVASEEGIKVVAFVDGDAQAHRKVHEAQMQRDIEAGKDWRDIKQNFYKVGSIGAAAFILGLIVLGGLAALKAKLLGPLVP